MFAVKVFNSSIMSLSTKDITLLDEWQAHMAKRNKV